MFRSSKRIAVVACLLFWWGGLASEPVRAADASDFKDPIQKLIKAFDEPAAARDKDVQTLLLALLEKIGAAPCGEAGDANTACKIEQVKRFASGVVKALHDSKISDKHIGDLHLALDPVLALVPADNDTGLTSAIDAATRITSAKAVSSPDVVILALDKLVLALQTRITEAKPLINMSKDKFPPAIAAMGRVSTNVGLILQALGANDSLIRVTGAWFGDLSAIRQKLNQGDLGPFQSTARYCSATRAVRARCQGRAQCYGLAEAVADGGAPQDAANGSTTEITGGSLCGYEPAPFAELRERGLIVRYECISAHDPHTWSTAALTDDAISPGPIQQGENDAQIRTGVIAEVRCRPVKAPQL